MDFARTADNPPPPGGIVSRARTADGAAIRVARWHPQGRARGSVLIAQGRAEFIEKYFETVGELLARGFCVVTFDWRGQGLSDRELPDRRKGHIDDFAIYERDLDAVAAQALEPFCPRPWFGLAHSMGGAILLRQAHAGRSPFARIALLAPMIDIRGLRFPRLARALADMLDLLGLGGAYVPTGGATSIHTRPFKGNRLTSDPARYARNAAIVQSAPDLALGDPTIGWVSAAFRMIDALADPEFPRRTRTPILVFVSGDDRVTSTPAAERFGHRLKAGHVIALPGARHEILQERDSIRAQFWAAFDAFVPGAEGEGRAQESTKESAQGDAQESTKESAQEAARAPLTR
jgi:lysophospholipase